jgi:GNAT superfamily N-acetyltransferase
VSAIEVKPFEPAHVEQAARLLAARHDQHRRVAPLLPTVDAEAQLRRALEDALEPVVAVRGQDVVGYLIGRQLENQFGTSAVVDQAGHAFIDPEAVADLYATASQAWAAAGLSVHSVFVPNARIYTDAWFRLSFGGSAVLAVRDLVPISAPSDVVVRPSTPEDLPAIARLSVALDEQLAASPSYGGPAPRPVREHEQEWSDVWTETDYEHFVAEREGVVLGHTLLYRRPAVDLRVPPDSIDLGNAATFPKVRGSGVGLAMTAYVIDWAREHGYAAMTSDWRLTNLSAARFWPRRGFAPVFVRLHRQLERVSTS